MNWGVRIFEVFILFHFHLFIKHDLHFISVIKMNTLAKEQPTQYHCFYKTIEFGERHTYTQQDYNDKMTIMGTIGAN